MGPKTEKDFFAKGLKREPNGSFNLVIAVGCLRQPKLMMKPCTFISFTLWCMWNAVLFPLHSVQVNVNPEYIKGSDQNGVSQS